MPQVKKKLSSAQKRAKKKVKSEWQKKYMWVFMNGKQVRVKRPPMIDGIPQDEWIEQNADPIWFHQNEMWEVLHARGMEELENTKEGEIPFWQVNNFYVTVLTKV